MKLSAAKCPNCGANLNVDEKYEKTVCDYCKSVIVVEEAVEKHRLEISGSIEVENLPKFENYLKLANMHFDDLEYEEAYEQYSKACELDPENYIVIFRKGLSKSLSTNYNDFEVNSAINGLKNAYNLLRKSKLEKEKVNSMILECNNTIITLVKFATDFYDKHSFNLEEAEDFTSKMISCFNALEYIYDLVIDDKDIEIRIIDNIIDTLQIMLFKYKKYIPDGQILERTYIVRSKVSKEYKAKMKYYKELKIKLCPDSKEAKVQKYKRIITNKLIKCLFYIIFAMSIFMIIGAISLKKFNALFMWILVAILYFPKTQEAIVGKYPKFEKILKICRILFLFLGIAWIG